MMDKEMVYIWIGCAIGVIMASVLWSLYVISIEEEIATKKPMKIGYKVYTCKVRSLK